MLLKEYLTCCRELQIYLFHEDQYILYFQLETPLFQKLQTQLQAHLEESYPQIAGMRNIDLVQEFEFGKVIHGFQILIWIDCLVHHRITFCLWYQ